MNEREIRELASDYLVSVDMVRKLAAEVGDEYIVVEMVREWLDEMAECGYGGNYD